MFKAVMICALFGLALAAVHQPQPQHVEHHVVGHPDDVHAEVLSRKDDVRADGFDASLETSNHITRQDSGDEHGNIQGSYGWISPEGQHIEIKFVADENGYQPTGDAIPAVPEHVARTLAWNAAHSHEEVAHHLHH
ncbi:larval cuticle protein 1-like [Drosophila sulfurigaster albostrigata]|uniref:larval cuticle protein 1-like n=1 Tax=Drosophila sulfurigaster albostrigata TaxID=89887 RepID=UPI002D218447|nr:larval cuticle protein 1-like [Drosophila sulfurigaster albostrigata]